MSEKQQAYISRVHLKGYKSIRDLEIDLKSGLNIIIGPNGSGKTNFLKFLSWLWKPGFFNTAHEFTKPFTHFTKITTTHKAIERILISTVQGKVKLIEKGKQVFVVKNSTIVNEKEFLIYEMTNDSKILHIAMPKNIAKINRIPFEDDKIGIIIFENSLNNFLSKAIKISFNKSFDFHAMGDIDRKDYQFKIEAEEIVLNCFNKRKNLDKQELKKYLSISNLLISNLKKYSPITNLAFDNDIVRQYSKDGDEILDNIFFKFFINDDWFYWDSLSDGTKRIFEIILCVINNDNKIIFLEEPELGIHPDQLYKLMDFLKEQSKEKQIILTTHSPEVLNILEKDELDRIIVTRYDSEKGTQMHHLSEKQIRKGHIYMEETGDLSDFWVHSNLEEYETETAEN